MTVEHWIIVTMALALLAQGALVTWALRQAKYFGEECVKAQDCAIQRGYALLAAYEKENSK